MGPTRRWGMTPTENGLSTAKRELSELQLLVEISQILDRSLDLREVVGPVLEATARRRDRKQQPETRR